MLVGTTNNPFEFVIYKDVIKSTSVIQDIYLYNEFTQKEVLVPHVLNCQTYKYLITIDLTGFTLGDYELRIKELGNTIYKEKLKCV